MRDSDTTAMDDEMNSNSDECILDFFDSEFMDFESNDHTQMILEDTSNLNIPIDVFMGLSRKECKRIVTIKLKEAFKAQYPTRKFSLRMYKADNWPPGVDTSLGHRWSKPDLIEIYKNIHLFRFAPKELIESTDKLIGLEQMECLNGAVLNDKLTFKKVYKSIFSRFQIESGLTNTKGIRWKYLDKSKMPEKYNRVPLNAQTIVSKYIYQNPELVNNIHFFADSVAKDELPKNVEYQDLVDLLQSTDE